MKIISFFACLCCLLLVMLASCNSQEGPRIFQLQKDLGIIIPWTYELVDFKEEWTESSFTQTSVLTFDEGDTEFIMREIAKSDFYNLFPLDVVPQLPVTDQEKFHTDMAVKEEIGYWQPSEKGYFFFCPAFEASVVHEPSKRLPNYSNKGLMFIVQAQFDIQARQLRYTYQSFTTPQKEWKKWNESMEELKGKAEKLLE